MANIPPDATLWDSGDWIEFHRRTESKVADLPYASEVDPSARVRSAFRALIQTARLYFQVSGRHLPVFDAIAELHGAVAYDLPLPGAATTRDKGRRAVIKCLPPDDTADYVSVDLTQPFDVLVVVKISNNLIIESRILARDKLPAATSKPHVLRWNKLPVPR